MAESTSTSKTPPTTSTAKDDKTTDPAVGPLSGGVAADTGIDAAGVKVPDEARETVQPKQDVVAVPSLRADGTPDQTSGFKQLVEDKDDARKDL